MFNTHEEMFNDNDLLEKSHCDRCSQPQYKNATLCTAYNPYLSVTFMLMLVQLECRSSSPKVQFKNVPMKFNQFIFIKSIPIM